MAKAKKMKIPFTKKAPKALILYIFLLPMFISTIASLLSGDYIKLAIKLIGFGLLYGATKLIDNGLKSEFDYNEAEIAMAPKHKYKMWGAVVLFIALIFIGLLTTNLNPINVVFTSILGAVGAYMYYGKDPSIDKLPKEGGVNYAKLINDIKEAKEKLEHIDREKEQIKDAELKVAIDRAIKKAHEILDTIIQDPKDISVARKFMVVYLDGVKDVITQYNDIDSELLDNSYRDRLISLLIDASERFEKELQRLKSNEIFDLDVQIDALKEQLKT